MISRFNSFCGIIRGRRQIWGELKRERADSQASFALGEAKDGKWIRDTDSVRRKVLPSHLFLAVCVHVRMHDSFAGDPRPAHSLPGLWSWAHQTGHATPPLTQSVALGKVLISLVSLFSSAESTLEALGTSVRAFSPP